MMPEAPNQILKTEIILDGISIAMAKIMANLYIEERKENPNSALIEQDSKKLSDFEHMRQEFYGSGDTDDEEYFRLIKVIQNEIKFLEGREISSAPPPMEPRPS